MRGGSVVTFVGGVGDPALQRLHATFSAAPLRISWLRSEHFNDATKLGGLETGIGIASCGGAVACWSFAQ